MIGLGLFASLTPSPLYRTYSVLWHFSPVTLTLIDATYAFGVLVALLLAGGVSDDVGRRPVLAALAVLSSWSIGAVFFSLGPQLADQLFRTTSAGSIALAVGMILIVVAAASDSSATYLVASILGGAGFGAAFLGGLRALVVAFEAWRTQPRRMLVRQEVAHAEA